MDPFTVQVIGSIVRWLLTLLAGRFTMFGELSATEVSAALVGVATLVWSIYQKRQSQQKIVTAIASPEVKTEAQLDAKIANPSYVAPAVTTAKTDAPVPGTP